ncbi:MAG TPA: heptaprenylglyceryl phosphate synthase [Bacilli bacterium]
MKEQLRGWRHIFKLDPERSISDECLSQLCQSGTHAIMVGGSSGVTYANTEDLLLRIRKYSVPCVLEISNQYAIVPGFDLFFVPIVLNTDDAQWIVGHHHRAIKAYGDLLPWGDIIAEAYVIMNAQSTAAVLTKANPHQDQHDLVSYARMADKLFHFPVLYLEYSGRFGDMELVRRVASVLENTRLFYGGGIDNLVKAQEAAQYAHTIIVGNVIYENFEQALKTVQIIKMDL